MFSDFYAIPEQPFGESPDPHFLYRSPGHSIALSALLQTFEEGHRLQALIGPPGLGKTTLLYAMLDRLRDRVISAFVFYTVWSARDLLGFMLRELGVVHHGADIDSRRDALERFLSARRNGAKPVLAIIDEAHNLDSGSLQEIDSLISSSRSFQVVLTGQTQLKNKLDKVAPPNLRKNLAASHHLVPLDLDQTSEYVRHRLKIAGYVGDELFSRLAIEMIAGESGGIPRQINMLCSHALDHGTVLQKPCIDEQVVAEVVSRWRTMISGSDPTPESLPALLAAANRVLDAAARTPGKLSVPREPQPWEHQQSLRLARALRSWLIAHSEVWSGTAWELYQELRSIADPATELSISSPADLLQRVELHVTALLDLGVDVEVRHRTGQPRRLMLRLVKTYPLRTSA